MHDGSTQAEVFAKDIFQMRTCQGFALHAEHGLIFEFHIDIGVRLQNGLIENSQRSHDVINNVIKILSKYKKYHYDTTRRKFSNLIRKFQLEFK